MGGIDKAKGVNNIPENIKNTPEYQKLKEEHPNSIITVSDDGKSLSWSESSGGIFNSRSAGGIVPLYNDMTNEEQMKKILNQMDEMKLDEYIEQGFLVPKKNFIEGEYYVFDAKKYQELTGKEITLGEIKTMLGLKDGVLRGMNNIGFKDHMQDEMRDYDTAPLSKVLNKPQVKIPKSAVFQDNASEKLGLY